MNIPELNSFALVGGTNLSLQLGYRLSVDLDLFTNEPFDVATVRSAISTHFDNAIKLDEMKQTIWYQINGVKTVSLKNTTWNEVKTKIQSAVKKYIVEETK